MRAPILLIALGLAAAGLARAEPAPHELRQSSLQALRQDGEFTLRATLHRAPASSALHENAEFSLLGQIEAMAAGACSDVIFRNGFESANP